MYKMIFIFIIMISQLNATENFAQYEDSKSGLFQFQTSNDMFYKTDKDYTGGGQFLWKPKDVHGGIRIGYEVYTPNDKESIEQPKDEHPYAGYKYVGLFYNININKYIRIYLGSEYGQVGPQAKGQQVQDAIHLKVGSKLFKGWDNQIFDQDVYTYTIAPKIDLPFLSFDTSFIDMKTTFTASATGGTLINSHSFGGQFKFGIGLPSYDSNVRDNFGTYYFIGLRRVAQEKNILLEGNTKMVDGVEVHSYGVTLTDHFNEMTTGITTNIYAFTLKLKVTTRGKQYKENKLENDKFATITIGYNY